MLSSIPLAVVQEVEKNTGTRIIRFSFTGGGCINHGGVCETTMGEFFLKWNDRQRFPGMFEAESKGLQMLRKSGPLYVPEVINCGNTGQFQFLLLENISEGARAKNYWQRFGAGLAQLHLTTTREFGLDHDNYIGSLPQSNTPTPSWIEFFREHRLQAQWKLARDAGKVGAALQKKFEVLSGKLDQLLPEESPSLVHGDLWGGNIMVTSDGQPCLIDPAIYFGSREMDLAMTQLFGGFDNSFWQDYQEVYPLKAGYKDRLHIYNLYPLLVHVNLFGAGYVPQVESILNKFV